MIIEIPVNKLSKYSNQFTGYQLHMVIASIREGNTRGHLWRLGQTPDKSIFLLWDQGNNVFYLAGESVQSTEFQELASLIRTGIKPRALKERLAYFKVHASNAELDKAVPLLFQDISLKKVIKRFYGFNNSNGPVWMDPGLENVRFALIDVDYLRNSQLQNIQYVRSEVEWMWASPACFAKHGFGFAALLDDRILCWCTAEYVSKYKCGIGIETVPDHQRRGIATATTAHFVQYCLKRSITPYWECDSENLASKSVAEKVGFELMEESIFWAGHFGEPED